jgi:hypothetical protein
MSEEEDDPFEQFDREVGDRDGNPFDSFDDPDSDDEESADDAVWNPDREEQLGGEQSTAAESSASAPVEPEPTESESPMPGLADTADEIGDDDVGQLGKREGDPFETAAQAFERMDVDDLDVDDVWEALSDAEQRGSVTESQGRTYAEVSKHSFCEHCEFFSAPPDVACSHEGTEILEFLDLETVRVVDCPVVDERRELDEQE